MSVITVFEVVPARLWAVVRYLQLRSPVKDAELRAALSPATLRSSDQATTASRVLHEAQRLGLIEAEGDEWRLVIDVKDANDLRAILEARLLEPELSARHEQALVGPALAWFLTLDPARPPILRGSWRSIVENSCPGQTFDLDNDQRPNQLAYWVVYLGYGWRLRSGDEALIPDPSLALARHLRHILDPGKQTVLSEVIARLTEFSPVFEGGTVRTYVETLMTERREPRRLSRSTSVALQRLEGSGLIKLDSLSDADRVTLDLWPDAQTRTHVTLLAGAA